MKISFATLGCPNWTMEQVVANAKAMGYDGVELRGAPGEHIGPDEPADSRANIRRMFAQSGVEIACIMGYTNFTKEGDDLAASIATGRKFIDVAADVGCPVLRIFCGSYQEIGIAEAIRRVVSNIVPLAKQAEKRGVKLAIETHDDWCKGENLRAVIDGVASDSLGVCWDIANAFFIEPLEKTYAAIADRIFHVHFKDVKVTPEGKHQSVLMGEGDVDLPKAAELLRDGGYQEYLSFEWEKKWQPAIPEPEVAFPHNISYVKGLIKGLGIR